MATASVHQNTSTPHPGSSGTLGLYLTVGSKLESAALRAREVTREATRRRTSYAEAGDRAAALRREAHREARAALADRWLDPRQVQLLLLSFAELVQASADEAASYEAEDAWIAAVSGLEDAAASIDKAVDLERDAPPVSLADVRAADAA